MRTSEARFAAQHVVDRICADGCRTPAQPDLAEHGADDPTRGREVKRSDDGVDLLGMGRVSFRVPRPRGAGVWLLVLLFGGALCVVATWPLVLHLGGEVPATPWDPFEQAWEVAWDGHALLHQPLSLFDANTFWPLHDSLAFSDSLVGYAPFGLVGSGFRAAIVRYDVLYVFADALAFLGGWALSREFGVGRLAALVGGAAFAFAPWRLAQADHLNILSTGGIALCLFLLLRGYRTRSPLLVLGGWAVGAWQVSLGFSLGLPFLYLLAFLAAASLLFRAARARLHERRLLLATTVGAAILVATTVLMALPYLQVRHSFPASVRPVSLAKFYSPSLSSLITAPGHERIWGALTASLRAQLTAPAEQSLFPGLVIVCLALLGLSWRAHQRSVRVGVAGAAVAVTVLALGFHGPVDGIAYQLLDKLPGWSGIRTPGRLITFTTLALAILAAIGAQRLLTAIQTRNTSRRPVLLTALLLVGAIVAEGTGSLPLADTLPPPASLASAPGPILVLPSNDYVDPEYMPWTTTSFQPLVNGTAGFIPDEQQRFRVAARTFPAAASISWLEHHGIRTVVLDRYYPPGDPTSLLAGYYPNNLVPNAQAILASRRALPAGVRSHTDGRYTIYTLPANQHHSHGTAK